MGKMPLKKHHIRSKTFLHCFIGAIDYIGIPVLIAYLSSFIMKIEGENENSQTQGNLEQTTEEINAEIQHITDELIEIVSGAEALR